MNDSAFIPLTSLSAQVVATGGDCTTLFADDELIDNIVPDLTLYGIAAAAQHSLAVDEQDDSDVTV